MKVETRLSSVQQAEIVVTASPQEVYAVVSDVTRTGEWSPECRRCEWVGPVRRPEVGARFRGYNRYRWLRWSRLNEILVADPGREIAFKVLPDWMNKDSSIWRYQLEATGEGTRLTESTEILEWPGLAVRVLTSLARRPEEMTENIEASLRRIKSIVESAAG